MNKPRTNAERKKGINAFTEIPTYLNNAKEKIENNKLFSFSNYFQLVEGDFIRK